MNAVAWIVGGLLWVGAGALHGDGWRFDAAAGLWIAADLFILAGLLGMFLIRPHGTSTVGAIALVAAVAARVVFVGGEIMSLVEGNDDGPLIPAGALLTAASLIVYGVVVARQRCWTGPGRFALLALGLYPIVAMFPVVAVTGEPSTTLIAAWGVPTALVGVAVMVTR